MNPHAPLRGRCRCASACIRDVGRYGVAGSMEERMGKEWEREEEEEKTGGGEKERTRERSRECVRGERAMMGGRRKEGFTHTNGIRLASGARIATLTIALVCGCLDRPALDPTPPALSSAYLLSERDMWRTGSRVCVCIRYDAKGRFTHIDEKLFPTDTRMRFASMCATRGGPGSSCLLMHSLRYHLPGKISHHRGQATPRTNW